MSPDDFPLANRGVPVAFFSQLYQFWYGTGRRNYNILTQNAKRLNVKNTVAAASR